MSRAHARRGALDLAVPRAAISAFAAVGGLLAACAQQAEPAPPPPATVYSADLQGGARLCTAPKDVALAAGRPSDLRMVVGNDGGWCAISVALAAPDHPRAYDAGLLAVRPAHGRVYIHEVGYATRIDYTPEPGYAGPDAFTVELLPGSATLQVSVTVQPAAGGPGSRGKA